MASASRMVMVSAFLSGEESALVWRLMREPVLAMMLAFLLGRTLAFLLMDLSVKQSVCQWDSW
jgi:hypothetical protein